MFAHRLVAGMALRQGQRLLRDAQAGRAQELLEKVWIDLGRKLPPEQRIYPAPVVVSLHAVPTAEIVLVTFPPAAHIAEAHLAAIVVPTSKPKDTRYFVLEFERSEGKPYTVLCEWDRKGSHVNMGPGPAVDESAFLTAVGAQIGFARLESRS